MPSFTHNGATYDVVATDMWDFGDATFAKRASGGMSVVDIEQGVMRLDPDAVIGFMAVSIHRVRKTVTAEKLRDEIENGGGNVLAWFEELAREDVGDVEGVVLPPEPGGDEPAR